MEQMQNADSYEDDAAKNAMADNSEERRATCLFYLGSEMRHHDHSVLYTCTTYVCRRFITAYLRPRGKCPGMTILEKSFQKLCTLLHSRTT